ncbi:S8 family peptidase [Aquabacterium sp.]|uniref:S8 family peptidase n=1 Tax=Aquabacterium sp. TaxID=1872578 RepID=UPI002BC46E66|nr:S8 family serine peptidase [Aquabacterium sp.]HSW04469.1 S8 family serine peptidase [Aquabacterium sp.]
MKKMIVRPILSAVATASALFAMQAQAQSVPQSAAEGTRHWFVELAGPPVADGTSLATVMAEKAAFRREAAAAGVRFTERRQFNTLFNGFSVAVDPANRLKLARTKGVKALYPVEVVARPAVVDSGDSAPDLVAALSLTGADIAQNQLGLSGKGVKVGIIDTGIDIDHPAFGGSGTPGTTAFPNARVIAGYDLVGDNYNSSGTGDQLVPVPDAIPDDCGGHGTHVAGIVGANGGGVKGVAPQASLGMYRVFGCVGTTDSDVILDALERAYADGMQVINQSLGSGRQWPQYPTAQASSRLVNKGVVMVASIGNNGPGGSSPDALYAAGAPGVGSKVIGVASFDNAQKSFTVGGTPYGYNTATGAPLPPSSGSLPMAKTGTTTTADDACVALPAGSLAGQAVLIRRGTCSFFIKASNVMNAGAAAAVLYNNAAGALNPTVAGTPAITIPVVAITAEQGAVLNGLIAAGPTTLTWGSEYVAYPFGTGGLISGFSSFGLSAELQLKPNIGAPGGGILSTYPLELGGTATLSGTSMSSPHVAGSVALILEAKPTIPAQAMGDRLQNVADPKNWSGNAALGLLDHSFRQGAGMLDIVGVITATATVSPSQISTGESAAGAYQQTVTVRNLALSPASYDIGHVAGVASGPNTQTGASYALSGVFDAPATVTLSKTTLNIGALGSASFNVTIAANAALPDRSLYGGYITLTPKGAGTKMSVPYAGFKGDYQATQVLTPTANGFPWLAKLSGSSFTNQPAGASYTLANGDIPYFLMHLDHMSREIKIEAFDAVSGKAWNKVSDDEYVTRSATPGGFFAYTWDGVTFRGSSGNPGQVKDVPNGQYVVKVSVLKALGDANNASHWETWTSPVITIARP